MNMKRIIVLLVFFVMASQTSWAARATAETISMDPYISALLIDAATGKVLVSEKPDAVVYPASVVKLMDLLIMLDRIEQGKNRLDEMVQVTNEAAKTGGSQVYLDPREQFTIDDLLYALMVQSANDAAVALAMHVAGTKEAFVDMMNQKAAELGMKHTRFYSVHGLPPSAGQEIDQTTAGDLALLCRALVRRPEALQYTGTKVRGFREDKFIMRNHNHLLEQVDGCDGLKTGYFSAAGFSIAATAKRGGNRVIAIVMGSENRKVRDAKTAELLNRGFALLPPKPEPVVEVAGETVALQQKAEQIVQAVPSSPEPDGSLTDMVEDEEQAVSESGTGFWKPFVLGLIVGIVLCGGTMSYLYRRRSDYSRRNLIRRL